MFLLSLFFCSLLTVNVWRHQTLCHLGMRFLKSPFSPKALIHSSNASITSALKMLSTFQSSLSTFLCLNSEKLLVMSTPHHNVRNVCGNFNTKVVFLILDYNSNSVGVSLELMTAQTEVTPLGQNVCTSLSHAKIQLYSSVFAFVSAWQSVTTCAWS